MLSLNKLIKLVPKNLIEKVALLPEEEFDFNLKDYCFLIREGEILSYAKNKFTQLLKKNDPIGLAEAILGKQNELSYRRVGAVKLYKIDSKAIAFSRSIPVTLSELLRYPIACVRWTRAFRTKSGGECFGARSITAVASVNI